MIVYHVDRGKRLCEGQILSLMPTAQFSEPYQQNYIRDLFGEDGVGMLGSIYTQYEAANDENPILHLKEAVFEYVRRIWYPSMPSRFQSFFSAKSLDNAEKWRSFLGASSTDSYIWEIEVESAVEVDSAWRDSDHIHRIQLVNGGFHHHHIYDAAFIHRCAINYWGQKFHNERNLSRLEYISSFPVRVLRKVDF